MSEALDEIVDLFETRQSRPRTVPKRVLKAAQRNLERRRKAVMKRFDSYEPSLQEPTLPRVKWLERPDPLGETS